MRPRSVGSFLTSRPASAAISAAVSRIRVAVSASRSAAGEQVLDHCGAPPISVTSSRAVGLGERHPDALVERGGDVLADVVGADRQLPVAAVDQDRELHGAGPAEVGQRVERGPDGAAGEEHVVDEDHPAAVDAAGRQLGRAERAGGAQPQVVAVEGDVERADGHLDVFEGADPLGQAAGQRDTPGRDAEQHGAGGAVGLLEDLMRDAVDHALRDRWRSG